MDKGFVDRKTVNPRVAIASIACLIALVAFPLFAHAETWVSAYPMGAIRTTPTRIVVDVFGAAALNSRTAVIKIGGIPQTTFVTTGPSSGHWVSADSLVGAVWKITWLWTADGGGGKKSTLYCYPSTLGDGTKSVWAAVKDVNGVALGYSWSFSVSSAPIFGAPTPAAGAIVRIPTPVVSIPVSDNSGVVTATATVNGKPATATLAGGKVTVTGFTLDADGPVTVVVGAADAAGNTATKTWTLGLSYFANLTCGAAACHGPAAYDIDNSMGADCVSCHLGASHATAHEASPTPQAITISGVTYGTHACSECHASTNLITLHDSTCATCHPIPKNTVAGVWAKGCVQGGCHTLTSSAPMHASIDTSHALPVGTPTSCFAVGCHGAATNLASLHSSASTTTVTGTRTSCQVCHSATGAPVSGQCVKCHDLGNPHNGADGPRHTANLGVLGSIEYHGGSLSTNITCVTCHGSDNLITLHGGDCTLCHAGPRRSFTTWSKGCQQGDCHPSIHDGAWSGHQNEPDCYRCHYEGTYDLACSECHVYAPDTTPPTTTHSPSGPHLIGSTPIVLSASDESGGKGVKATYYRVDGGAVTVGTQIMLVAPTSGSASHTIEYWSADWSRNVEATHVVPFIVSADTTPPITATDAKITYNGPAVVHFTVADDATFQAGCTTYYSVDGAAVSTGTDVTVPQPITGNALHTLRYWSVDKAGNPEIPTTTSFTIVTDAVAPSTTCDVPHYWNPASFQILNFHITDPTPSSGIADVGIDVAGGGVWNKWSVGGSNNLWWRASLNVSGQGPQQLTYWAVDNAGNQESHVTTTVIVDWTPPTTSSDAVADYVGAATITFTATDTYSPIVGTKYALSTNPGALLGSSFTVPAPVTGSVPYYAWYYSGDAAGNWESSTKQNVQFRVWAVGTPTLTYNAGIHGSVTGKLFQPVLSGGNGVAVTAVASGGYHFVNWSDGSTANPRTDITVVSSKNVTANFATP